MDCFSSSERVSIPDRLSLRSRLPVPDRFSSPPIVGSPLVAWNHRGRGILSYFLALRSSSARWGFPRSRNCRARKIGMAQGRSLIVLQAPPSYPGEAADQDEEKHCHPSLGIWKLVHGNCHGNGDCRHKAHQSYHHTAHVKNRAHKGCHFGFAFSPISTKTALGQYDSATSARAQGKNTAMDGDCLS